MSIHVVLYQPEIPSNTGNIARTCLGTGTTLHLIHPLGFSTDDKMLRRAGLDYWKKVKIHEHQSLEELFDVYPEGLFYYIENFGVKDCFDYDFSDQDEELFFVFGRESKGIPKQVIAGKEERCLRIPMNNQIRSLNLANTAAIVIYEALRQQNFPKMN